MNEVKGKSADAAIGVNDRRELREWPIKLTDMCVRVTVFTVPCVVLFLPRELASFASRTLRARASRANCGSTQSVLESRKESRGFMFEQGLFLVSAACNRSG